MKTPKNKKKNKNKVANANTSFKTIAIGTSAGGLEALKVFFDNVPADCNHSFVVVQHLSPDYKSLMAELLAKNTEMPIHEVEDKMKISSGSIYLIPPKKNMTIEGNVLKLSDKPAGHDLNLPIDIFFRSLADTKGEHAIGVILSGTGSDGTRGLRAIKEAGGIVMVQSPEQAKFDGMPRSAINTGLVDYILPVEQLPGEILNFINNPKDGDENEHLIQQDEENLGRILNHIRNTTDLDFTSYKRPTLVRRIARRMGFNKCVNLKEYLNLLYDNPKEVQILYKEFLIGVTKFFRDARVWETLERDSIPQILKHKQHNQPVKVWVTACSTGEEAYSVAILIHEALKKAGRKQDVKIFATDIEKDSLDKGSKGIYPESIVADISPERLGKYFMKKGDEYQVTEELRRMIIFSHHNLLVDPPFNKMDMVLCRNMLIYVQPVMQKKAMTVLHYSLNLNGILVLGSSETVGDYKNVFSEINRKNKIYRNTEIARTLGNDVLRYPDANKLQSYKTLAGWQNMRRSSAEQRMSEALNEALVQVFGYSAVFVDENCDILHAIGEFRKFVELPEKGFSVNLLKMVPENMALAISSAIRKAVKQQGNVMYKAIKLKKDKKIYIIDLLVKPFLIDSIAGRQSFVITIIEKENKNETAVIIKDEERHTKSSSRVKELEDELKDAKENLQATIEEVETSNEELQATNEELLAANEELQSTNEELQSVNEELHTVNAEHQMKIDEVTSLNSDMNNLLKSTEIGTIFLDKEFRIRKFTPAIKEQFNLIERDLGRPISHFTSNFGVEDNRVLLKDIELVMETGKARQKEMHNNKGKWFLKRVFPFWGSKNAIDGVVISFIDINELKKKQEELSAAHERQQFLFDSMNLLMDAKLDYEKTLTNLAKSCVPQIADWCGIDMLDENGELKRLAVVHIDPEKVNLAYELAEKYPENPDRPGGVHEVIRTGKAVFYPEIPAELIEKSAQDKRHLKILLQLSLKSAITVPIKTEEKNLGVITLVTSESNRKYTQNDLAMANDLALRAAHVVKTAQLYSAVLENEERFKSINQSPINAIVIADKNGNIVDWNTGAVNIFGYEKNEVLGKSIELIIPKIYLAAQHSSFSHFLNTEISSTYGKVAERTGKRKNGEIFSIEINFSSWKKNNEIYAGVFMRDITGRKKTEQLLVKQKGSLEKANRDLEQFAYVASHDIKAPVTNMNVLLNMLEKSNGIHDDSMDLFGKIKTQAERMQNTISTLNEVIALKRNIQLEKKTVSFQKTLTSVLNDVEDLVKTSKAKIIADFSHCKMVRFPQIHLQHILQNLITNSIKYQKKDKPPVIHVRSTERNGWILLSVADNGRGIDAEKQKDKLFGLFQRFHPDIDGKGIGLHVTKSILENYGGKIEVESKSGEGSTFNIYFEN